MLRLLRAGHVEMRRVQGRAYPFLRQTLPKTSLEKTQATLPLNYAKFNTLLENCPQISFCCLRTDFENPGFYENEPYELLLTT